MQIERFSSSNLAGGRQFRGEGHGARGRLEGDVIVIHQGSILASHQLDR